MKKYAFIIAAFAAAVMTLSCQKEDNTVTEEETIVTPPQESEAVPEGYERISFSLAITKTSISGEAVSWTGGEEVLIYWGSSDGEKTVSSVEMVGGTPVLNAVVSSSATDYYAVYPAAAAISFDGSAIQVQVNGNNSQNGAFDTVGVVCAKTTKAAKSFAFHHVYSYFKVNLPAGITQFYVYPRGEEQIVGPASVTFDGSGNLEVAQVASNRKKEVHITNANITSSVAATYYLAIYPGVTLSQGMGFRINGAEGWYPFVESTKSFKTVSGEVYTLDVGSFPYQYDYFVKPDSDSPSGNGTSWDDAAPVSKFVTLVEGATNSFGVYRLYGRRFHFAEGVYAFTATLNGSAAVTYSIDGGYSSASTGKDLSSRNITGNKTYFGSSSSDSPHAARVFTTGSAAKVNVSIEGIYFWYNQPASGNGGAINFETTGEASLNVSNTWFRDNKATAASTNGGAIYATGGSVNVTVSNTEFRNSAAQNNGGALCLSGISKAEITATDFVTGTASNRGGGIWTNSPTYISNSYFNQNKAETANPGSGVFSDGGTVFMDACAFYKNSCTYEGAVQGAVIYAMGGFLGMHNCTVDQNNTSTKTGRSFLNIRNSAIIVNSTFLGYVGSTDRALLRIGSAATNDNAYVANNVFVNRVGSTGASYGSAIGGKNDSEKLGTSKGYNYMTTSYLGVTSANDTVEDTNVSGCAFTPNSNKYYTWTVPTLTAKATKEAMEAVFSDHDTVNSTTYGATFLDWLNTNGTWGKDYLGASRGDDNWTPGAIEN